MLIKFNISLSLACLENVSKLWKSLDIPHNTGNQLEYRPLPSSNNKRASANNILGQQIDHLPLVQIRRVQLGLGQRQIVPTIAGRIHKSIRSHSPKHHHRSVLECTDQTNNERERSAQKNICFDSPTLSTIDKSNESILNAPTSTHTLHCSVTNGCIIQPPHTVLLCMYRRNHLHGEWWAALCGVR